MDDVNDWIERRSRPFHTTVSDIESMEVGKSVNLLILHDAAAHVRWNRRGVAVRPSTFFKKNMYLRFTKIDGFDGLWMFTGDKTPRLNEEFYLECGCCETDWIPLSRAGFSPTECCPDDRIGWRGPLIAKDDLEKAGCLKMI